MRSLSILCLLLISASSFLSQCAQSPTTSPAASKETATVAGNVLRLDSGEPLKKAKVILLGSGGSDALYVFYLTDEGGHFLFENVPPGSYHLQVSRNGYVDAEYGQKKPGARGAMLTLVSGQRLTDLVFKLSRTASISGHVFDEDGEPIAKAGVQVYRASQREGKEQQNNYEPNLTNDLGEFRIFDLAPGRYYLAVNYRVEETMRSAAPAPKQKLDTGYQTSYYPNTSDPSKAQAISVGPGDEVRSVDFILRSSHLVTVSGKLINLIPATAEAWGDVSLNPRGSGLVKAAQDLSDHFKLKDGNFVIRNVPPGSYYLYASWSERDAREWHHARRELDVGNTDLDGVTITVSNGVDIPGRVTWEGGPPGDLQFLHVRLHPLEENPDGFPGQMVKPDATFQFKNIPEGAYRPVVSMGGLEENFFLKSVHYGTALVTGSGFTAQPGVNAFLELTLSTRAAHLNGVVLTAESLPAVGAAVVMIPDPPRRIVKELFKSVTTDQNGKFSINGIAPGDYKLFSWDSVEEAEWYNADWYDPDWLKPYETKGEAVHLDESDRKAVNLTVIETRSDSSASN
jgi:hypothetical protein